MADKVALTFTPDASSDYCILAHAVTDCAQVNSGMQSRLRHDTAAVDLAARDMRARDVTDFQSLGYVSVATFGASPGSNTFSLEYSAGNAVTTGIQQAYLTAFKLEADDEFVKVTSANTTNSARQTGATLSWTPPSAGDYVIIASAGVQSATENAGAIELYDGTTAYAVGDKFEHRNSTSAKASWFAVLYASNLSGAQNWSIRFNSNGSATVTVYDLCIVALRVSDWPAVYHAENQARTTTTQTTPQDRVTLTQTLAEGDHVLLYSGIGDHNSTTTTHRQMVNFDGSLFGVDDVREPFQTSAEQSTHRHAVQAGLSAASHTWKSQWRANTSGTSGISYSNIVVLQPFESAAAGVGTATGTGTAIATGAVRRAGAGTAAGTGAATSHGAEVLPRAGTAAGAGTATAAGVARFVSAADGTATGAGTAAATGRIVLAGAGTAAGAGVASAVGLTRLLSAGAGTSLGEGTATATGSVAGAGAGAGLATGTGAAAAVGQSTGAGAGTAAAAGDAAAIGAARRAGTGTALGVGAASGAGFTKLALSGAGTALGAGAGAAQGAATARSEGIAAASGTSPPASGASIAATAATGAGNGIANAGGAVLAAVLPDAMLASTNLQDTNLVAPPARLADIQDDPDAPDGDWFTAIDPAADTILRLSLASVPGGDLVTAQAFELYLRKTGDGDPTVAVELWEDGELVQVLVSGIEIASLTGQKVVVPWEASLLADISGANAEIRIVGTAA